MCSRIAVALILASGCVPFGSDVDQPISLTLHDFDERERAEVEVAAGCWNVATGTDIRIDDPTVEQRVDISYETAQCFVGDAVAEFRPGLEPSISICPTLADSAYRYFFFPTISHELGHALNLHHTDDGLMHREGPSDGGHGATFLSQSDREEWHRANGAPTAGCPTAGLVPAHDSTEQTCGCKQWADLDLGRPIQIDSSVLLSTPLEAAATCWNLRFGLQLVIGATDPDVQTVRLEQCIGSGQVVVDGVWIACAWEPEPSSRQRDGLFQIADALDLVGVRLDRDRVFHPTTKEVMASRYPSYVPNGCPVELVDGACRCAVR